jgi:hypothetical protein
VNFPIFNISSSTLPHFTIIHTTKSHAYGVNGDDVVTKLGLINGQFSDRKTLIYNAKYYNVIYVLNSLKGLAHLDSIKTKSIMFIFKERVIANGKIIVMYIIGK